MDATPPLSFDCTLPLDHASAVERVTQALAVEGFGILTRIDVHKALKEKIGVEFRPYTILGACNPPIAHKALSHEPKIGLLLPCNVTVERAGDGASLVRIGNPEVILSGGGFDPEDPVLREVASEATKRLIRVAEALRS